MAELLDESSSIESVTVGINRTSSTVKGGRRFSFSALVVVGDRRGRVGLGYQKANQVPQAIEKSQKEAKRKMRGFSMQGQTIPHEVEGRFGACGVRLLPASPGTGVTAGSAVRAVLEMLGVKDCLTKCYGSSNSVNLVKATMHALSKLRRRDEIEALRGVVLGESQVGRWCGAACPSCRSRAAASGPRRRSTPWATTAEVVVPAVVVRAAAVAVVRVAAGIRRRAVPPAGARDRS